MKNIKTLMLAALGLSLLALGGCASTYSPLVYQGQNAMTAQQVQVGRILSVRRVAIAPSKANVGSGVGTIAGVLIGSRVAHNGIGQAIGAMVGAVAGGVAGNYVDQRAETQGAYVLTVNVGGSFVAVTQSSAVPFHVGEAVQVITSGNGRTRVLPL